MTPILNYCCPTRPLGQNTTIRPGAVLKRIANLEIVPSVRPLFQAAGWRPGRRVAVDSRVPTSHPAHAILEELGGLRVGHTGLGLGIECAASDLDFCFDEGDAFYISTWSALLESAIVQVATVHNDHGWFYVDEDGRCFGASQVHDAFYFEGPTFSEATESVLVGRRSRPMLRPDQQEIDLYGETFARGHPAIFDWQSRG